MKACLNVPIRKPEDVIPHLGRGQRHWRKGYSAQELAVSWFNSDGIPSSVMEVLDTCPDYENTEIVDGFFERSVDLRTPGFPSETDLMVIASLKLGLGIIAVEGKVEEPFGQLVKDWNNQSEGKVRRLAALCKSLELDVGEVSDLRYQLLHRTASAIYEAQRYRTDQALMLVHSFSKTCSSFDDFVNFSKQMGIPLSKPNKISDHKICEGVKLRLGWVQDQPAA